LKLTSSASRHSPPPPPDTHLICPPCLPSPVPPDTHQCPRPIKAASARLNLPHSSLDGGSLLILVIAITYPTHRRHLPIYSPPLRHKYLPPPPPHYTHLLASADIHHLRRRLPRLTSPAAATSHTHLSHRYLKRITSSLARILTTSSSGAPTHILAGRPHFPRPSSYERKRTK